MFQIPRGPKSSIVHSCQSMAISSAHKLPSQGEIQLSTFSFIKEKIGCKGKKHGKVNIYRFVDNTIESKRKKKKVGILSGIPIYCTLATMPKTRYVLALPL